MANNMTGNDDLFVKLKFLYPSFTKSQKRMADMLIEEYEAVSKFTISKFAEATGSSIASVVRFCTRLGLSGFLELKQQLINAHESAYDNGANRIQKNDSAAQIFRKISNQMMKTLQDTLILCDEDFDRAIDVLANAGQVSLFGVGDAWVVCEMAHIKFQRIGLPCFASSDIAMSLAQASLMKKGDLAIGVSFSGETRLVIDSLRIAKEQGATTLAIVQSAKCELVKYADLIIYTATVDHTPGNNEIARRTAEFAVIDTLFAGLVTRKPRPYIDNSRQTIQAIIENK